MTSIFFAFMGSSFGGCYCFFMSVPDVHFGTLLLGHYRHTVDGKIWRSVHARLTRIARLHGEKHALHHTKCLQIEIAPLHQWRVILRNVICKIDFDRTGEGALGCDAVSKQLEVVARLKPLAV